MVKRRPDEKYKNLEPPICFPPKSASSDDGSTKTPKISLYNKNQSIPYAAFKVVFLFAFLVMIHISVSNPGLTYQIGPTTTESKVESNLMNNQVYTNLVETSSHEIGEEKAVKKIAVVHVGPHKTGTSTIQDLSLRFKDSLEMDNYEMPWTGLTGIPMKQNQVSLATCFYSPPEDNLNYMRHTETLKEKYPCVEKMLINGPKIAERNNSIFITSEEFDRAFLNLQDFKDYLKPWDEVKIIVYYRRFYDWAFSSYNSQTKRSTTYFPAFHEMKTFFNSDNDDVYTFQVFQRYKRFFDNVAIMNMHDKSKDLTESFYCDTMPHAEHTCNKVKSMKKVKSNSSKSNAYMALRTLALAAKEKDYIDLKTEKDIQFAMEQIQNHQENTLGNSVNNFKFICPSKEQYDILLQKSLQFEKELMPDFFASPIGEAELRSHFEETKAKMCSVDHEEIINSKEWIEFFSSLKTSIAELQ